MLADARNERDSTGQMIYPNGLGAALGLAEVGVPELAAADILVVSRAKVWLVTRNDFQVDISRTGRSTGTRWPCGYAVASRSRPPDLPKGLRKARRSRPAGRGLRTARQERRRQVAA